MVPLTFAGLIAPCSIESFFENYWEKNFLYQQQSNMANTGTFFNIADLDKFLSQQSLLPECLRLVKNGIDVTSDNWTKSNKQVTGLTRTVADPEKILKLYNQGTTIIINAAESAFTNLADICRSIEQELRIKVQSNIYITPASSQGFHKHYDTHDIFLYQVKGPKTWKIYNSGEDLPTSYAPFKKEPVLISEFAINSGDFLYLPRGVVHEAFSSEVSTIHVNFSLKPKYGFHLLEELAKIAEKQDPFFRRTIPHGLKTEAEIKEYLNEFTQKVNEILLKITPQQLLQAQQEDFIATQTFDFSGRLTDLLLLENLNLNSVVSRRTGFTYTLKQVEKAWLLKFGGKVLKIPDFIEKDIFFQDEKFHPKDIKGLITNDGRLALVKEFILAGYLSLDNIQ